nr:hypothetical protein GCM10025732_08600 [Glycomyces mayteni]
MESVDPSPIEIEIVYATLLLAEARLDRVFSLTPSIAEMKETGVWPKEFVAIQAATERLIERCVDTTNTQEVRGALDEWIRGYALSSSDTGWKRDEIITEAASLLAEALASDDQDKQELRDRLLTASRHLQQGSYPSKAIARKWGFRSSTTGQVVQVRWGLVYELGVVIRGMTFDVYQYGRELIEQLGIVEQFTLEQLKHDLETVQWAQDQNHYPGLNAKCFDPAVEEALRAYVQSFRTLDEALPDTSSAKSLTRFVLLRATGDGVGPRLTGDELAYRHPITRLTLNSDKIRQLLMGEQLYGDPRLAMRELYQNALDACRYRQYRHEYLRHETGPVADWSPTIRFESHSDANGALQYLDCIDNGVGMKPEVLERCFLNAGSRFVETAAFADEQAEWLKVDQKMRLIPNSSFGIGAFSYFMLADAVEVWTRPQDVNGNLGEGLRLLINAGSSIARVTADEKVTGRLPQGGTIVRLHLRPEFRTVGGLQLRSFLDEVVLHSPYQLEIAESGEQIIREPNAVSTSAKSSSSLAWTDGTSTAWWAENDAAVLADGLITSTSFTGAMVTLHGEHKPLLRVDRNAIVNWDLNWVLERTAESAETLANWDGLSLRWLWSFSEAYPRHGAILADGIKQVRPIIPLGQTRYWAQDIDLREIGCFPGDRYLLWQLSDRNFTPHFSEPRSQGFNDPRRKYWPRGEYILPPPLRAWRSQVWRRHLPSLFDALNDQGVASTSLQDGWIHGESIEQFPIWESADMLDHAQPDPIDTALLVSRSVQSPWNPYSDTPRSTSDYLDLVGFVWGASQAGLSLGEAVERVAKFTRYSLMGMPSIPEDSYDYIPDTRDSILISVPAGRWNANRVLLNEEHFGLVSVCHELGISLGEGFHGLESILRRLGLGSPELAFDLLNEGGRHVPSSREAEFFGQLEDGRPQGSDGIPPVRIRRIAEAMEIGESELDQIIQKYSVFRLDKPETAVLPSDRPEDAMQRKAWSTNFDGRAPWIDSQVFGTAQLGATSNSLQRLMCHSLFFSVLESISASEAARMVSDYPGLTEEQRAFPFEAIPSIVPTQRDLEMMKYRLVGSQSESNDRLAGTGQYGLILRKISPYEMKLAMEDVSVSAEELADRIQHFEYLGIELPIIDFSALDAFEFTAVDRALLITENPTLTATEFINSQFLGPVQYPIPARHVFSVAEAERLPLGDIVAALDRMKSIGVTTDISPLTERLSAYTPKKSDGQFIQKLSYLPAGAVICGTALSGRHTIGKVVDQIAPWIAWVLGEPEDVYRSRLDTVKRTCGSRVPDGSDMSFFDAVTGQAKLNEGGFGRHGALVLAAQAGLPVGRVVEKFNEFQPLFDLDGIYGEDLDSMTDEMLATVPDCRWVIAACEDAVIGKGAAEARIRLGVDDEISFAVRKFTR